MTNRAATVREQFRVRNRTASLRARLGKSLLRHALSMNPYVVPTKPETRPSGQRHRPAWNRRPQTVGCRSRADPGANALSLRREGGGAFLSSRAHAVARAEPQALARTWSSPEPRAPMSEPLSRAGLAADGVQASLRTHPGSPRRSICSGTDEFLARQAHFLRSVPFNQPARTSAQAKACGSAKLRNPRNTTLGA